MVDHGVLDGNQCWLLRNAQERKERRRSPTAWVAMPHPGACLVCTSPAVLPVTSSQHQSCLSQQLEMPLSECNCISAARPQSQWIIWHHRPWWIISDHMPWKTHIPHESQRLCHMHSGLSIRAPVVNRLGLEWKHGRQRETGTFSPHPRSRGVTALVSSGCTWVAAASWPGAA